MLGKDKHIHQWNTIEKPETDQHKYAKFLTEVQ